jgi:hypothetical protein
MDRTKIEKLSRWFKSQKKEPQYFARVLKVPRMSAIPADIGRNVYVVEKAHQRAWVVFNCPCERGHRLVVNLSRNRRPCWKLSVRKGLASLWPSLWLKEQCRSHFWIRRNRIYWAISDDQYPWEEA